jgi:hypothetical protein
VFYHIWMRLLMAIWKIWFVTLEYTRTISSSTTWHKSERLKITRSMRVTISSTTWCTPYLPLLIWLTTKMRLLVGTNFLDMCPWTDSHGCHPSRKKSILRATSCPVLKHKRRDQLEWLLQVSKLSLKSASLILKSKKS